MEESGRYVATQAPGGRYRDTLIWFMLFVLSERPMHGYEIIKRISELTSNRWKPAAGSIYPLLSYMKELGLIEVVNVEEGVRGGRKIVYRLTDKGWKEFHDMLMRKSQLYMTLMEEIAKKSIEALRQHGYEDDALRLCDSIRAWAARLAEALSQSGSCSEGAKGDAKAP